MKILYGVFLLIVLFILANNWQAFDAYFSSFSRFGQSETQILQGRKGPIQVFS